MFQKVTAFMLALLIGSPMCWCGWMHSRAPAASAAVPACCHAKAKDSAKHESDKSKEDCPCAHAPKARDVVSSKVSLPSLKVMDFHLLTWTKVRVSLWDGVIDEAVASRTEHGPPREAVPLYMVHCSLLI
ncbi:MAG: hypothetical protein JNM99_07135 [Verrucomicrobiaceae bacterium]|nr:hypothetical protein [Verrucomicrobiaceae bacterium]